jgi:hypothetical protein
MLKVTMNKHYSIGGDVIYEVLADIRLQVQRLSEEVSRRVARMCVP